MRQFPLEYEASKPLAFFPERPTEFGGDILEVGPGRGDLLLALAEQNPGTRFVAVEVGKKRYFKLIPRIEKKGLENVLLIKGDARVVLPRHYVEQTFERIYVLFPDPWPKERHSPNRLMTAEFITLLASRLRIGGELFFATDVASYTEWVVENAQGVGLLKTAAAPSIDSPQIADYIPTFFELKWRADGRQIHYLLFQRI